MKKAFRVLISFLLVVCAVGSILLSFKTADDGMYQEMINTIEKKERNALMLTASTTTISVAISTLKEDTGSQIAQEIAELNDYLLIILSVLLAEKYLLSLLGLVSFRYLLPASFLLCLIGFNTGKEYCLRTSHRLGTFAIVIFLIIPISISVTEKIDDTFKFSQKIESINDTAKEIEQQTDIVNQEKEEKKAIINAAETEVVEASLETGFFDNLGNLFSGKEENGKAEEKSEGSVASNFINRAVNQIKGILESVKNTINLIFESIAIFFVTSCIIPILTAIVFISVIKKFTGADFTPMIKALPCQVKSARHSVENMIKGEVAETKELVYSGEE